MTRVLSVCFSIYLPIGVLLGRRESSTVYVVCRRSTQIGRFTPYYSQRCLIEAKTEYASIQK